MSTAKVVYWNAEKRFGFCVRDTDKKSFHFHASVLENRNQYFGDDLKGQTLELKRVNEIYYKGPRVEGAIVVYDESLLGEALILAISKPRSHVFEEKFSVNIVTIDGERYLATTEEKVISATEIKFKIPCRRRAIKQAVSDIRLVKGCTYITLFNPHDDGNTRPVEMSNLQCMYEYGDFHGGKWAGFFKVINPLDEWELKLKIPKGRYNTDVETYKGKGVNLYEES